jgi:preprotein translocase subunit SecD
MAIGRRLCLLAALAAPAAHAADGPGLVFEATEPAAALPVLRARLAALGLSAATLSAEGARITLHLPPGAATPRLAALLPRPGHVTVHRTAETEPGAAPLDLPWPGSPDGRLRLAPTPAMQGALIAAAAIQREPSGEWSVLVTFHPAEARRFHELTRDALGQTVALLADGAPLIAAVVREPIGGGRLAISGRFTRAEAEDIAALLAGGPLPGTLRVLP